MDNDAARPDVTSSRSRLNQLAFLSNQRQLSSTTGTVGNPLQQNMGTFESEGCRNLNMPNVMFPAISGSNLDISDYLNQNQPISMGMDPNIAAPSSHLPTGDSSLTHQGFLPPPPAAMSAFPVSHGSAPLVAPPIQPVANSANQLSLATVANSSNHFTSSIPTLPTAGPLDSASLQFQTLNQMSPSVSGRLPATPQSGIIPFSTYSPSTSVMSLQVNQLLVPQLQSFTGAHSSQNNPTVSSQRLGIVQPNIQHKPAQGGTMPNGQSVSGSSSGPGLFSMPEYNSLPGGSSGAGPSGSVENDSSSLVDDSQPGTSSKRHSKKVFFHKMTGKSVRIPTVRDGEGRASRDGESSRGESSRKDTSRDRSRSDTELAPDSTSSLDLGSRGPRQPKYGMMSPLARRPTSGSKHIKEDTDGVSSTSEDPQDPLYGKRRKYSGDQNVEMLRRALGSDVDGDGHRGDSTEESLGEGPSNKDAGMPSSSGIRTTSEYETISEDEDDRMDRRAPPLLVQQEPLVNSVESARNNSNAGTPTTGTLEGARVAGGSNVSISNDELIKELQGCYQESGGENSGNHNTHNSNNNNNNNLQMQAAANGQNNACGIRGLYTFNSEVNVQCEPPNLDTVNKVTVENNLSPVKSLCTDDSRPRSQTSVDTHLSPASVTPTPVSLTSPPINNNDTCINDQPKLAQLQNSANMYRAPPGPYTVSPRPGGAIVQPSWSGYQMPVTNQPPQNHLVTVCPPSLPNAVINSLPTNAAHPTPLQAGPNTGVSRPMDKPEISLIPTLLTNPKVFLSNAPPMSTTTTRPYLDLTALAKDVGILDSNGVPKDDKLPQPIQGAPMLPFMMSKSINLQLNEPPKPDQNQQTVVELNTINNSVSTNDQIKVTTEANTKGKGKGKRGSRGKKGKSRGNLDMDMLPGDRSKYLMARSNVEVRVEDTQCVYVNGQKRWKCLQCPKMYTSKHNLISHILGHSGIKPFCCNVCGKYFKQAGHLYQHVLTHGEVKPHVCSICERCFTQGSHLKRHMAVHMAKRPHVCAICDRGFVYPSELKSHMEKHAMGTEHSCEQCGETMETQKKLKHHMAMVHGNVADITCKECGKVFPYRSQLRDHMIKHSGKRPYQCSICAMSFLKEHHLKAHQFTHTGLRPFVCSICMRAFNQKANLQRHLLIHQDIRRYKCEECDRTFTQPQVLKAHMVTHAYDKPFQCPECGKKFTRAHNLNGHMHIHKGSKPHSCFCGSSFTLKGNLNRHKKEKHGISDGSRCTDEEAAQILNEMSTRKSYNKSYGGSGRKGDSASKKKRKSHPPRKTVTQVNQDEEVKALWEEQSGSDQKPSVVGAPGVVPGVMPGTGAPIMGGVAPVGVGGSVGVIHDHQGGNKAEPLSFTTLSRLPHPLPMPVEDQSRVSREVMTQLMGAMAADFQPPPVEKIQHQPESYPVMLQMPVPEFPNLIRPEYYQHQSAPVSFDYNFAGTNTAAPPGAPSAIPEPKQQNMNELQAGKKAKKKGRRAAEKHM